MAKLFSKTKIIRHDKKGNEEVIAKGVVFDATVAEAKQFDALNSARQATSEEVKAADARKAQDNGHTFQNPAPSDSVVANAEPLPDSGADGDPKSAPKGKST